MASPIDKPLLHGRPPYSLKVTGAHRLDETQPMKTPENSSTPMYSGYGQHPKLSASERQKELMTGFLIIGILIGGWGVGEALLRLVQRRQFGTAANVERSAQFYHDQ